MKEILVKSILVACSSPLASLFSSAQGVRTKQLRGGIGPACCSAVSLRTAGSHNRSEYLTHNKKAPPRHATGPASEQVVCPDTAPPHAPALAAPPQGACWLLCGWGATATPTSVERASALLLTAPHAPAPCPHAAVMAVELVLDADINPPQSPTAYG